MSTFIRYLIVKIVVLLLLTLTTFGSCAYALAEKPVNFIFLVDVSGSMVARSTMVTDQAGNKVTLFESLRQALAEIIADHHLIKKDSRVCFITFGTEVKEMKDWPSAITNVEDRNRLINLIKDKKSLDADRKGDTYMGGALALALSKAIQFRNQSDPCTTTFILMLTDGWDEPPANAKYDVRELAKKVVEGQSDARKKVGIDTWQIAVISLKSLPGLKAGTTTAQELSSLLNATFLDVTREKGENVSGKIHKALTRILLNQRGQFKLSGISEEKPIDFGEIDGQGQAKAAINLELKACDQEEITAFKIVNSEPDWATMLKKPNLNSLEQDKITRVSQLEPGALSLSSEKSKYSIEPIIDSEGKRCPSTTKINLVLKAGSNLPVGRYLGCLELESSARVPDLVPFIVLAPARLTTSDSQVNLKLKHKGFPNSKNLTGKFTVNFLQVKGSQNGAVYKITASVKSLHRNTGKREKSKFNLSDHLFNTKEASNIVFDTNKEQTKKLTFSYDIPPTISPGVYQGLIQFKIEGPPELTTPSDMPIEITIQPSDWEQVAPVAIPMIFFLVVGIACYIFLALKTSRS